MTLAPALARAWKQIAPDRPTRATLHCAGAEAFASGVEMLQMVAGDEGIEEAAKAAWTQLDASRSEFDFAKLSPAARAAIVADAQAILAVLAEPTPELAPADQRAESLTAQLATPRGQR